MKNKDKSGAALLAQGSTQNCKLDVLLLTQKGLFWQVVQDVLLCETDAQ